MIKDSKDSFLKTKNISYSVFYYFVLVILIRFSFKIVVWTTDWKKHVHVTDRVLEANNFGILFENYEMIWIANKLWLK